MAMWGLQPTALTLTTYPLLSAVTLHGCCAETANIVAHPGSCHARIFLAYRWCQAEEIPLDCYTTSQSSCGMSGGFTPRGFTSARTVAPRARSAKRHQRADSADWTRKTAHAIVTTAVMIHPA